MFAQVPETAGLVERLMPDIIGYGLKIMGVIVLFVAGRWVGKKLQATVLKRSELKGFDMTLGRFFASLVGTSVLVLTIVACLSIFGIDTASLAAVLAGAALAIGLAFQGSLSNFAAGIMLIMFRPFRVGDLVTAAGNTGVVFEMGLFATHFDTTDNRRIIVPNSAIFGSTIVNLTHHPIRRVDVPVGTAYGADLGVVRRVLEAAALAVQARVQEPAPMVYLKELGASSIDWELRVWSHSRDYFVTRQECIVVIKKALDEAKISIPFPQLDVHIDTLPPAP